MRRLSSKPGACAEPSGAGATQVRHFQRERDQQHHARGHRRVEHVLPQTAEHLLADDDGEQAAQHRDPPGRERRQRDRQQPCGQDAGTIHQHRAHGAALHAHDDSFADDGGDQRDRPQVDCGPAVQPEAEQCGGRERQQHRAHHFADGNGCVGVGGMGDGFMIYSLRDACPSSRLPQS